MALKRMTKNSIIPLSAGIMAVITIVGISFFGTIPSSSFQASVTNGSGSVSIISNQSLAVPSRVPNNGTSVSTLWVKVSVNKPLDIEKVFIDLRPLNGNASARMERGDIIGDYVWYFLKVTVPSDVGTSDVPKELVASVQDVFGNIITGKIFLTVTNNAVTSDIPQVLNTYGNPQTVSAIASTPLQFYSLISDSDGLNSVKSVVIDLGPIGIGPTVMEPLTEEETVSNKYPVTNSEKQRWYKTEEVQVPVTVSRGIYLLEVMATDSTGMTGKGKTLFVVSNDSGRPSIDTDSVNITPTTDIANDGKSSFTVTVFISDPNTLNDINSVILDLGNIGRIPQEMTPIKSDANGMGGWFILENITVSKETIPGLRELKIRATDKSGGADTHNFSLNVLSHSSLVTVPVIENSKGYTTPSVISNDETTRGTLYAFVSDEDDDVTSVIVNLGNIARYVGEKVSVESEEGELCKNNSDRIVCMQPSIQEGESGKWYVLPDVVVLPHTKPSTEPYRVQVISTDSEGNRGEGFISMYVGDGSLPEMRSTRSRLIYATATDKNTVELIFDNNLDSRVVQPRAFRIVRTDQANVFTGIFSVYTNANATVVTLKTDILVPDVRYTVIADSKILGLKESKFTDNSANFLGYRYTKIPPQLAKVKAVSRTMIELVFLTSIKPSTVTPDGSDFSIFATDSKGDYLRVSTAELVDNQTILISTKDQQDPNKNYRIRVKNLQTPSGIRVIKTGLVKEFSGFSRFEKNIRDITINADFTGDGVVDFSDFTIFSQAYGQQTTGNSENTSKDVSPTKQPVVIDGGPFPLNPSPNTTDPHTSEITP